MTNYLSKKLILIHQSMYEVYTQQEKIQRTEEKRCTVNHVAEIENWNSDSQRTEVQRYPILMRLRCTERCPNGVISGAPFLLRF